MATRASKPGAGWPVVAGLAALAVVAQLYGVYRVTGPPSPPWFPHADKAEHAVGFALPVGLVVVAAGLRALSRGRRPSRRALAVVVAVFAVHGVVSELVQHFLYTTRSGDPFDVLADWTGTALGAVVAWAVLGPARVELRRGSAAAGGARSRAR
jgi:VanZ family protein